MASHGAEDKWKNYSLDMFLGKQFWEVGGPILTLEHLESIIGMLNPTSREGHLLVEKLRAAIDNALRLQQGFIEEMQRANAFPELEGEWLPIRLQEWMMKSEASHPKTREEWGSNGEGHFENGDWESGTLKVVGKSDNLYFVEYKMVTGEGAGLGGHVAFRLLEDGSKSYEMPLRFLQRKPKADEAEVVKASSSPEKAAAPPEPEGDRVAVEPEGGSAGTDAPAPEGKKDA
mmetsp:Transcript_128612/g.400204  ORF Transcript_128612/g.400204 Transcript_128612/m.400204 type:complete len:231 (-) Transcript_128612:255-947(-)